MALKLHKGEAVLFWVQRRNVTRVHERQLCSSGEDAELYIAQIPADYGGPTGHSAGPFMPRSLYLTVTLLTHLEMSDLLSSPWHVSRPMTTA